MKISLPFKVGFLMLLVMALASVAGYFTYTSFSSIVRSIEVKSRPDLRLLTIRDIAADLDKAETSVRMYRLSASQKDIAPYYSIIAGIDAKIDTLRSASVSDTSLLAQIDTISSLIEENMIVWNKMLDLYHSDSLEIYIRKVTAKIAIGSLSRKNTERNILKRVFSRKALRDEAARAELEAQQDIINDLTRIEKQDSVKNSLLLETEEKLASTGSAIRERMYRLIARMENEVITSIKNNSLSARQLAGKTYRRLAWFAFSGAFLVFVVIMVVIRYVRKTRAYQQALEKSKEETENLARTKELFLANMSHELRTPVNAIHGFAEQLGYENLNEKSRKMTGIIKSTSEHLVQIVNDLLDYSRLQNAKIELEKTHFQILPIFEELDDLFSNQAVINQTRISYSIGRLVPPVLYGDSHRLKQILFNLIGNAIKFTRNGEVHYSADALHSSDEAFDLVITVKDTGIGIKKDLQKKVFEDFTQADNSTGRKFGGTGLGLSIVKKLVELQMGTISLESDEGIGSTFTCIFPYRKGSPELVIRHQTLSEIPAFVKNLKVLIVDDEEYNRMLFKTIFTRWNVQFDEAEDGRKALEYVKEKKYDIVFMDARMPGLSGIEAVTYIRTNLGVSAESLPIIGTSASHSEEDLRKYLSSGMNAFLPKPFGEKMLLDLIVSVARPAEQGEAEMATATTQAENKILQDKTGRYLIAVTPPEKESEKNGVNLANIYHLANNDLTFVRQLIHSFIDSTEQGLSELASAAQKQDAGALHEIAHKISSPCRHLGADQLYSQLKMIEQEALYNKNIGKLATITDELKTEFQHIKISLLKHLETL